MSYQEALIGKIDIEGDDIGTLVLNRDGPLTQLNEQYGLIGGGMHIVASNPIIQSLFDERGVESIQVSKNGVLGLDNLSKSEHGLVAELFRKQYDRSERIFEAAKNAELEELDAVAIGVAKGVLLGALPAVYFDAQGIQNIGTELGSRAGPGLIEASSISQEVEKISGGKEKSKLSKRLDEIVERSFTRIHEGFLNPIKDQGSDKGKLAKLFYDSAYHAATLPFDYFLNNGEITKSLLDKIKTLGQDKGKTAHRAAKFAHFMVYYPFDTFVDAKHIIRRMPAATIRAVDIGYWFERFVLRKEITENFKTDNQRWADAQESGPYRGLIALGALKYLDSVIGPEQTQSFVDSVMSGNYEAAAYTIAIGVAIGTAKFWINTGNNVQGIYAVYNKYYNESTAKTKWGKRKDAWKHLYDDAFQKAQIWICSGIYGIANGLEFAGLQAEKLFGNIGAAAQSAGQSGDTAYSALAAKRFVKNKLLKPAEKSFSDFELMVLADKYGSEYVMNEVRKRPENKAKELQEKNTLLSKIALLMIPNYRESVELKYRMIKNPECYCY